MKQRTLLFTLFIAGTIAAPVAFAQSLGVGVGGNAGVQAGPVSAGVQTQGSTDVSAQPPQANSDGTIQQAADAAREGDEQVGDAVRDVARDGSQAANASDQAVESVSGNATAAENSAVTATTDGTTSASTTTTTDASAATTDSTSASTDQSGTTKKHRRHHRHGDN